jgi:hypothetical protein
MFSKPLTSISRLLWQSENIGEYKKTPDVLLLEEITTVKFRPFIKFLPVIYNVYGRP